MGPKGGSGPIWAHFGPWEPISGWIVGPWAWPQGTEHGPMGTMGTMGPGTRDPRLGTRDPGPETRDSGPGTRDPRLGSRDPGPETRDPGPGTSIGLVFIAVLMYLAKHSLRSFEMACAEGG